jgi:hypothetical protein
MRVPAFRQSGGYPLFALVNPYAGTFGPETIAPEKSPLPFGHSSRSGLSLANFPCAQVRCFAPPPWKGFRPARAVMAGFHRNGVLSPNFKEKDHEKRRQV